ncbi:TetR/AcrR family transcriptional regulator [Enterococcus sp. AZ103]|uniref:TetR/AcrR family transcriptional regulator n=1 Tax=Enterococcus sp. AZ103 TaxID=2774628 RepID=UPI003F259F4E
MKKNKQISQSKMWLWQALYNLMEEQTYESITIKQIAEKAQLDRRTFYRHYRSKKDIIHDHLTQLLLVHFQEIKNLGITDEEKIICQHFYFLKDQWQLLQILKKNDLFDFLLTSFTSYNHLFESVFQSSDFPINKQPYQLAFKAGGFLNAVSQWLEQAKPESPEEMAKIITTFYHSGVE